MLNTIKENVVKPTLTRLGFLLTGWLVGMGVQSDYAHMVATGLIGSGLIMCDLLLAFYRKRKLEKAAFYSGLVQRAK